VSGIEDQRSDVKTISKKGDKINVDITKLIFNKIFKDLFEAIKLKSLPKFLCQKI